MTAPHEHPTVSHQAAALAARMAATIPVIETERCRLRAPRIEDFEIYAEIACSAQGEGIGGPMTREAAWADFIQVTGTWLLRGHGGWTLASRMTGDVLGFVLIGFEPGDREPELGYLLRKTAEGQGYATEACGAVRDHAFGTLGLPSLVSYIHFGNDRSVRLAERLGAARDAGEEAALPNHDKAYVYRYPRPETAR